jgi:hypothetical protein
MKKHRVADPFGPDIKVRLDYNIMTNGRDQQIEAAVAELLKK